MKIHRIRFQNINSLRGEHVVDFNSEPLKSAGLFAIIGPTGSGKSTLLDVICLALFNKVPRMNGAISRAVIEKTGSIVTRNTKEAFAEVDYHCSQGNFRSRWEISTASTGKLRDYHMEVMDLQKGKLLDAKRSQVPSVNEGQIGLNYDQFVKSIMLAQGEFAKFLQANKSDRSALLEKITGTSMYRQLGVKAFEMNRLHNAELTELRNRQQVFKDQLLDDLNHAQQEALQSRLQSNKVEVSVRIKELDKQLEHLEAYKSIQAQVHQLAVKETSLKEEVTQFELQDGRKLKAHNSLAHEANSLQLWQSARVELSRFRNELLVLKKGLQENAVQINDSKRAAEGLMKTALEGSDLLDQLDVFQKEVQELLERRNHIGNAYNESLAETRHLKKWNIVIEGARFEDSIDGFKTVLEQTSLEISELRSKLDTEDDEDLEKALSVCSEQIQIALQAKTLAKTLDTQSHRIQSLESENKGLHKQLEELPSAIKLAKEAQEAQQKTRDILGLKLENQKLRASLDAHRTHLEEGKPCPLCGALKHPFAIDTPEMESELEIMLQEAEVQLKQYERNRHRLEQEKESKSHELEKKEKALREELGVFREQEQQLASYQRHFSTPQLTLTWEALEKQLFHRKTIIEQFIATKEKLEALQETEGAIEKLKALYREGKENAVAIKGRYSGSALGKDVRVLRESWIALKQSEKTFLEQEQKLKQEETSQSQNLNSISDELLPILKTKGFGQIEEAIEARLPEERYQHLQERLQKLQESEKLLAQTMRDKQAALLEKADALKGVETSTLQNELLEKKNLEREVHQQLEEVNRQLKNHQECLLRVQELQKQMGAKEQTGKKWELLNQYIGDATGKKFNDFAQDLTLSQLVQLANRRLSQLNDRYILDRSRKDEDDSLMVLDAHMGNERRSVKTLSGGESFILSLSLALALSDLASRNVEINSLFIDEGFGTLDPEILDQTLDTLERLQSEGSKTIGIISHVEALKERITTKIQLIRNGQGYSSLKVVAQ